ncbi:NAD+ transporter 2 [Actinidia rufa]|uniref:NAD+ transporter 2 n=1 Tax=Actinidia rufa TaxID=165716 RepID=A0A7J0FNX4_9ERIC|nr:NAD+ transporter 2 [Actinidia rufa]
MTAGDARPFDGCWSMKKIVCDAGAGASAGAIAATVMCPLDVIKTRLQVYGLPERPHSGEREPYVPQHSSHPLGPVWLEDMGGG